MVTINQKANVPVNNEKQRKKFHLLRASAVIQLPATCHQAHNNHIFITYIALSYAIYYSPVDKLQCVCNYYFQIVSKICQAI
ncbi:hypothetical protein T10_7102 [Trichinella papuae]|uniref:Uncharacterized protein n=1 Tax=Trichinella papuae TaxID=268474 RepID=A0A0V1N9W0_9BILA|nr:hypothetical protein T10_7102 [Trichinella papuae]